MGKLIKNHWARLVILIASAVQIGGAIEGFFWPKVTWDFFTSSLNVLVKPYPILQIINIVLGVVVFAWEWPLSFLTGNRVHRSIHARLVVHTLCAFMSICMYQSHNAVLYYILGIYGYALALGNRETIYPEPWTIPPADALPGPKSFIIDPERGDFPRISEFILFKRNTEIDSMHSSKASSTPRLLAFGKYTRASKPSAKYQTPINETAPPFPDPSEMKGPFKPYKRSRSNTWHT